MAINIAFFGASVTKQKNGYVTYFTEHAQQANQSFAITRHSYPAMHLNNAGMCFIPEVLATQPQYCFIDWFSTSRIFASADLKVLLDTLRYQFIPANCQLVFLLLGGSAKHMFAKRLAMYDLVEKYAQEHEIPCINIWPAVQAYDENVLVRDAVHTTPEGGKVYGSLIYHEFMQKVLEKYPLHTANLVKTRFVNIKTLTLGPAIIREFIRLRGNAQVLGLQQTVGPHSGLVSLDVDGTTIPPQNLWDRWCYYERNNLKIRSTFTRSCDVLVSQDDFDRAGAMGQADWSVPKVIKPDGPLYYIGTIDDFEAV